MRQLEKDAKCLFDISLMKACGRYIWKRENNIILSHYMYIFILKEERSCQ